MARDNVREDVRIDLFVDREVSAEADLLRMSARAAECAALLLNAEAPLIYGLCGPWGSGKSSFLGMLEDELQDDRTGAAGHVSFTKQPFVVRFNAWKYAYASDIVLAFLFHMAKESQVLIPSSSSAVRKELEDGRGAIVDLICQLSEDGFGKLPFVSILGKSLSLLVRKREKTVQLLQVESTYDRVRTALTKLVRSINDLGYRVIVLIDEIDRCLPSDVVRLMDGIRICLFDDTPVGSNDHAEDIIYVIAMDEAYVARAYKMVHKIELADAYTYLEKFLQFKYHMFVSDIRGVVVHLLGRYEGLAEIEASADVLANQIPLLGFVPIRRVKAITLYTAEWLRRWVYQRASSGEVTLQERLRELASRFADDKSFVLSLHSYLCEIAMIKICFPHLYDRFTFSGQQWNLVTLDEILHKSADLAAAAGDEKVRQVLDMMELTTGSNDLLRMALRLSHYRASKSELRKCLEDSQFAQAVKDALSYLNTQ